MELSQSIKAKIKAWEGCRLTAYRCPSGVLTIGYGHTGPDVIPGKQISREEADALFEADIERFAASVAPMVDGVGLRPCQFDALVSLAYNIGAGAFYRSTLLNMVRANPDDQAIRREFESWVYGNGRKLAGLVARRMEEANHYFGKI